MPITTSAPTSNQDSILNAFVSQIGTLSISLLGVMVPVAKRKLPKKDEQLNPPVQIVVCSDVLADQLGWMCFGTLKMRYRVQVVIISPNNNDNLTNLPVYTQWRQQIRNLFDGYIKGGVLLPGISPPVYDMDYRGGSFLPRDRLAQTYDYQDLNYDVMTTESP